jgi:fumarate reductase subunit D
MSEENKQEQAHEDRKPATEISIDENRLMAALSYLGFLFLVPLLAGNKKDPYVNFHLRQGIVLFIAVVIVSVFAWIPFIGWFLAVFMLALSIYGFIQALSGNKWKLPYIGKYAEKINI